MKLIQLTDIHLTAEGKTIGGRDPNANFECALRHVEASHGDAALAVITGDLSDWGDRADYIRLRDLLAGFAVPTRLCIGNHDDRETFLGVFPEFDDGEGHVQGFCDTPAGRCLFLDTWGPETHAGHYCPVRQAWFERNLDAHDGPFFIFLHHNPIPTYMAPLDRIRLLDDAAFREIVRRYRERIRHIFFGHCHLPMSGSIHGVPVSSLRGTNHQAYADFSERSILLGADLPPAYGVVFVADDHVTVQMVEFGYAGAVRDAGSPDYAAWNRETMVR